MRTKTLLPWVTLTLLLGFMIAPRIMFGQDTGAITGTVTDSSGAVVPNATVTITDTDTGVLARTSKTNASGIYVGSSLLVGTYKISVEAPGFERATREGITLHVADRLAINFVLSIGAITQSVQVKEAQPLVQTQTGAQSQTISTRQMTQLPILGRNFFQLQELVPGAINVGADENGKGFYSTKAFSINGFNMNYTGYQLDGVQNTDMGNQNGTMTNPGPDALAEFRVLTSNYSAKYGTAGGAELLAVTKSGTQQFHGDAYEFLRNDAFDATDFFLNANNQHKSPLRYNDYGYTIGGPFYIPRVYNTGKTKTFFFWSQEWIRESNAAPIVAATPTAAMRSGDFSGVGNLTNPISPITGQPLTGPGGVPCVVGSQVNPGCLNSNVQLLLNQDFPAPNAPGFFNFIQGAHTGQNWGEQLIRIDQNISPKIKAFVRFIHDSWLENDPTTQWSGDAFPTLHSQFNIPSRNFIAHVSTVLSPSLLNEVSYNYASNYPASSTPAMLILGATQKPAGYTAKNVFNQDYYNFIPDMSFSQGYGGISTLWGPWWAHHNISQASDDLTKEVGAHSLQMGVTTMFSITPVQSQTSPSSQGSYFFDGHFTGNAIADAVLGLPESYSELEGRREPYYNYHQTEAYFQDDWKFNRRLTLNLGVRYFAMPHVYGQNLSMFLATDYNAAQAPTVTPQGQVVSNSGNLLNGIVISGKNGASLGLVQNHWNTVAPRFGFAWDVTGSGKTAVRGGYGIGYYRIEGNDVYTLVGNPPFSKLATFFTPPFDDPASGVAAPLTPLALNGFDPIYDIPTVQNWSLGVQRLLSADTMLSVAYVGSRGTHLDYKIDENQPLPAMGYDFNPLIACTPTTPVACAQRVSTDYVRPYQGWSSIINTVPVGTSIYHSLQVNFEKKLSQGLSFGAVYTWSKTLGLSGANGLGSSPQNSYNLASEYGPAAFDRTHVFVFHYLYNVPFFQGLTGIEGGVLKGWELSGVATLESGFALTSGFSSSTQGLATRPDAAIGQSTSGPSTVAEWFNTGAFMAPPFGRFGNDGVGTIWGPPLKEWDMGIFKNFRVSERAQIQFRAESFNALNAANFDGVQTTLGSGGFGQITSAHLPRTIQFALKFIF